MSVHLQFFQARYRSLTLKAYLVLQAIRQQSRNGCVDSCITVNFAKNASQKGGKYRICFVVSNFAGYDFGS
jgi:hypothetical protein